MTVFAIHVIIIVFLHPVSDIVVTIIVLALSRRFWNGPRGDAIPKPIFAHVLNYNLTVVLSVTATVLHSPLEWHFLSVVKVERTNVGTTPVVVLGIKQTVDRGERRGEETTMNKRVRSRLTHEHTMT